MRSSDLSSLSSQQLFESIAASLATAIVRMHARGLLDQSRPESKTSENPGENGQNCLELSE
jgi:hypothetical protein